MDLIELSYDLKACNKKNRQRNEKRNEETILIEIILCRKGFPILPSLDTIRIYLPSDRIESFCAKYNGRVDQKHCELKEIAISTEE